MASTPGLRGSTTSTAPATRGRGAGKRRPPRYAEKVAQAEDGGVVEVWGDGEQTRAAMRAFTEAIRLYPDFQAVWLAIGKLFAEQGIPDKAELAFIKGQRLEPLNPDAYFCLGTLYLSQRELDLSIPYLEKAVLLDPQMEEAYVMLGRAYLQANNIDNLGAMATAARQWFPGNSDLEALLATYYFRRQDYVQAFELASAVLTKDPRNMLAMTVLSSPAVQSVGKR
jgi:tetratricopeptide (TPR) repeat protein